MTTLAITGLPNSGKSSLFAALTGRSEGIAPFPFSTTAVRMGVLPIEDRGLAELGKLEGSARITRASLQVSDTPPRQRPSGEADTETVGFIRQADCLLVVLGVFSDVRMPDGGPVFDSALQVEETLMDLALNDADVFERTLVRLRNQATSRPERRAAYHAVARATEITREGHLLRSVQWSESERAALADFAPLTLKPVVWVVNGDEDTVSDSLDPIREVVPPGDPVVKVTAALEAEIASMDPEDQSKMREGFELGEGAPATISRAALEAMDLCMFFTTNARETRAWLTKMGSGARQAAGKIHSDMERGFIRAEVASASRIIEAGGWEEGRSEGLVRIEGKDYPVRPRDVLQIRFSV